MPGMPVTSEFGGITVRSVTTAPAAMMELAPMWAPLRMVAPMPMRTLSSMVQPWTVALWPMLTPEPMSQSDRDAQKKVRQQEKKAANDRLKAQKEHNKAVNHDNKAADAASGHPQ